MSDENVNKALFVTCEKCQGTSKFLHPWYRHDVVCPECGYSGTVVNPLLMPQIETSLKKLVYEFDGALTVETADARAIVIRNVVQVVQDFLNSTTDKSEILELTDIVDECIDNSYTTTYMSNSMGIDLNAVVPGVHTETVVPIKKIYKGPVCRGSWKLNNNCKTCERCRDTRPSV